MCLCCDLCETCIYYMCVTCMETWDKGSEGSHYQISEPVARTRHSCNAEESTLLESFPSYRNVTCLCMRVCIRTFTYGAWIYVSLL